MPLHPEAEGVLNTGLEPTIGDEMRFRQFKETLAKASRDDLLRIAEMLARQAFIVHPASIRFLVNEAAGVGGERMNHGDMARELTKTLMDGRGKLGSTEES